MGGGSKRSQRRLQRARRLQRRARRWKLEGIRNSQMLPNVRTARVWIVNAPDQAQVVTSLVPAVNNWDRPYHHS